MMIQPSLLLLLLLTLQGVDSCQGPELVRELVLAKVKALFLDALGPPAMDGEGGGPGIRRLPRRHALGGSVHRTSEPKEEGVSQVILFPATGNDLGLGKSALKSSQCLFHGLGNRAALGVNGSYSCFVARGRFLSPSDQHQVGGSLYFSSWTDPVSLAHLELRKGS